MPKSADRPKRVKVGARWYDVVFVDTLDQGATLGDCCDLKQRIRISKGQAFEGERDTLLHELLHSVDDMQQTRLRERQVHLTASGVLALLRDNPALVKYLCEPRPKTRIFSPGGNSQTDRLSKVTVVPNLNGKTI